MSTNLFIVSAKPLKVCLDKWLWAARFFRTRTLAMAAISAGKVLHNGSKTRPNRELITGDIITMHHGIKEITIRVSKLVNRRRNAAEAQGLFEFV